MEEERGIKMGIGKKFFLGGKMGCWGWGVLGLGGGGSGVSEKKSVKTDLSLSSRSWNWVLEMKSFENLVLVC